MYEKSSDWMNLMCADCINFFHTTAYKAVWIKRNEHNIERSAWWVSVEHPLKYIQILWDVVSIRMSNSIFYSSLIDF